MPELTDRQKRRIQAIEELGLLQDIERERYHRIVRLVRRHFGAGSASITIVGEETTRLLSQDGTELPWEIPSVKTMCSQVVESKDPVVVTDLSREAKTPAIQELITKLDLKFYAGVPILGPKGEAVGALCVMDHVPRSFSRRELESLADFASIVEDEICLRRADATNRDLVSQLEKLRLKAFLDPLTQVWNRGAIFDLLSREASRSRRLEYPLSIAMLDLDHFKAVNDTHGHPAGDAVLQETCRRLHAKLRSYDAIGRYGGEEFLLVFPETSLEQASLLGERLRQAIEEQAFPIPGTSIRVTASIGIASVRNQDTNDAISRADAALYRAKDLGRNRVETDHDTP